MTNYTITNDLFVVNSVNIVCGGPYKNEESAKRRVRNLRQKDADALNGKPEPIASATPNATIVAGLNEAETAATSIAPPALPDLDTLHALANKRTVPDAAKLAASSAYGKTNSSMRTNPAFFAAAINAKREEQRGVYPAISKRERRRQWNA